MEPPSIASFALIWSTTVPLKMERTKPLGSEKHVIVIDEFSMLDFYLFRTIEGLCRRFAKHGSSRHPWGGRHVILLGDPAQLLAVSGVDIFSTCGISSQYFFCGRLSVLQIPL